MIISWLHIKDKCLLAISEASRRGDTDSYLFFLLLYRTGLRGNECLSTANWVLTQDERILIPSNKRGNPKLIQQALIPSPILAFIKSGKVWNFLGSLTTYQRTFLRYSGLVNCYVGGKRITLHTFRHVWIKDKVNQGADFAEINASLGIRKSSTTLQYIIKKYKTEAYNPNELQSLL